MMPVLLLSLMLVDRNDSDGVDVVGIVNFVLLVVDNDCVVISTGGGGSRRDGWVCDSYTIGVDDCCY